MPLILSRVTKRMHQCVVVVAAAEVVDVTETKQPMVPPVMPLGVVPPILLARAAPRERQGCRGEPNQNHSDKVNRAATIGKSQKSSTQWSHLTNGPNQNLFRAKPPTSMKTLDRNVDPAVDGDEGFEAAIKSTVPTP